MTVGEWWVVNQLPVLGGNLIGGLTLTAGLLYFSHRRRISTAVRDADLDALVEPAREDARS